MEELIDKIAETLATIMFFCIVGYMFYDFYKKVVILRKKQKEEIEREKLYKRYEIEAMVKYIKFLNGYYQHGKI